MLASSSGLSVDIKRLSRTSKFVAKVPEKDRNQTSGEVYVS